MYRHTLEQQVEVLVKAGLLDESRKWDAVAALEEYWWDKLADIWHAEDVLDYALNSMDRKLTMESAVDVIGSIKRRLDATIGVNWDVLDAHIQNDGVNLPEGSADIWKEEDYE